MADQNLDIVVRVQQLTQQAFDQVSKELKKLETQANQTGTSASKGLGGGFDIAGARGGALSGTIEKLTGAVARFAGPAAVGLAIKATINWADGIADLSEKTSISIKRLQQFESAANGAGIPVETFTTAVGELAKRVGAGDTSAVAAIQKLGLSVADIKAQKPEDAFVALGKAIGQIPDQYTRAALEQALFGKSGKDLDGILKNVIDRLDDTKTAADANVIALGNLSDKIGELFRQSRAYATDGLGSIVRGLEQVTDWSAIAGAQLASWLGDSTRAKAVGAYFDANGLPTPRNRPGLAVASGGSIPGVPEDLELVMKDLKRGAELAADRNKRLARAAEEAANAIDLLPAFMRYEFQRRLAGSNLDITGLRDSVGPFINPKSDILIPSRGLPGGGLTGLFGGVSGSSTGVSFATGPFSGIGKALGAQLPGVILGAFQGGGNVGQSIGGAVGGTLVSGLATSVSKAIEGTLGSTLGSAIPIVGTLLGGLAGKLIGGAFGYKPGALAQQAADKDIRGIQGGLLQQFGSVDAIAALGPQGAEVAAAWNSRNVAGLERFKKLVDDLNKSLEYQQQVTGQIGLVEDQLATLRGQQVPTWQALQASAEKYGINLEALGPTFQQLKANDFSQQLLSAFEDLTKQSGDVGGILVGMKDEISNIVQQSIKFKTTIPENMRPLVEELARSGQLLDENGDKITDLSGLKWGAPVKTQADIISDAIQELNETLRLLREDLSRGLPKAAQEGTAGVTDVINGYKPPAIDVDVRYNDDGAPVSTSYARGGIARRPTRAIVGDSPNGPEIIGDVAFMTRALSGALARLRPSSGGREVLQANIEWDGRIAGRMFLELGHRSAQSHGLA